MSTTTISREGVDLVAEVRRLHAHVDALAARVDTLERLAPRAIDNRAILNAILTATHGRVFTARELIAHGRVDRALGDTLRGLSARQLGRRLRTLATLTIDGWTVERVTRDNRSCFWIVKHRDTIAGPRGGV